MISIDFCRLIFFFFFSYWLEKKLIGKNDENACLVCRFFVRINKKQKLKTQKKLIDFSRTQKHQWNKVNSSSAIKYKKIIVGLSFSIY